MTDAIPSRAAKLDEMAEWFKAHPLTPEEEHEAEAEYIRNSEGLSRD